ncbi:MAG: hypothetical protein KAI71_00430 [Candidatus Pacebacteria bacterium]|nr:hypothetical protein [Candidatus Paceibacterota bacterium]
MAKKTGTLGPVGEETGKGSVFNQIYDLIGGKYLIIAIVLVVGVTAIGMAGLTTSNVEEPVLKSDFTPFSETGTIRFLNTQLGHPVSEILSPAELGLGVEKTDVGYVITNSNEKFVFLTFDTPDESGSVIVGPNEQITTPHDIAMGMSFPDKRGIIGTPEKWGFISVEDYIDITKLIR